MIYDTRSTDTAGIIFDLDGVLWDSSIAHTLAFNEVFLANGLPLVMDYADIAGMRTEEAILHHTQRHGALLNTEEVRLLTVAKRKSALKLLRNQARLAVGLTVVLEQCRAHYDAVGLCTCGSQQSVHIFFENSGCAHLFDCVVYGSEVVRGKPSPDIFLLGAERLGLAPRRCVVVEDSVAGIQGAIHAGMKVLGLGAQRQKLLQAGACMTIDELRKLPDLFSRLAGT